MSVRYKGHSVPASASEVTHREPRWVLRQRLPFPDARAWRVPTIFSWLQREGRLSDEEMARTFNCGLGAALVVSGDLAEQVLRDVRQHQEEAWLVGSVVARPEGSRCLFSSRRVTLSVPVPPHTLPVHLLLRHRGGTV